MAYIRQLESGLWAATVYTPAGRITQSRMLRAHIVKWANKQKVAVADGDWIDPRGGKTKISELWDLYADSRPLAKASRARDASHWRTYVQPRWGKVPCGAILKPDINAWIVEMQRRKVDGVERPVGAASIQAAVGVLRAMLEIAVDARMLRSNTAATVKAPGRAPHLDRILDEDEDELLLANLDARFPGRCDARLFVELMLYCGLRYEEAAALDRDHVDMRRRLIFVGPVMEKDGTIRDDPKSEAGGRPTAVDDHLWPRLREHVLTVKTGELVFTTRDGGHVTYDNWLKRVWKKALLIERPMTEAEIEAWKEERRREGLRPWKAKWIVETPLLDGLQPTPHDLRHTFGTRLGESLMPIADLMAIMGHEDYESSQRYLHARDGRFEKQREAMHRARGM